MDPITAVANALSTIVGGITGIFTNKQQKDLMEYSMLPDWLTFDKVRERDNTMLYVNIALFILIVVVIIMLGRKAKIS